MSEKENKINHEYTCTPTTKCKEEKIEHFCMACMTEEEYLIQMM